MLKSIENSYMIYHFLVEYSATNAMMFLLRRKRPTSKRETTMPSVYDKENFQGRVNHAAAVIMRRGETTRHFDTCFERDDGDAVAAALIRRAEQNATLAENLPRYVNMATARAAAEELKGKNLAEAARKMRKKYGFHGVCSLRS